MKYIVCNRHSVLGDYHLFIQEPQTESLKCQQDNCRQYQMDKKSIGKNLSGISVLLPSSKVMKRLVAALKALEMIANIETKPPTTLEIIMLKSILT